MNMKPIVAVAIALTVGIVTFSGVLIPAIESGVDTEDTFTNIGAFYVEVNPTDTYTIEYDKATEVGVVYINDEPLNVEFSTGYTILAIDNAILRLQSGDSTIQYKGNGQYITGIKMLNITVSDGSISGTFQTLSNESPVSWPTTSYTKVFIASTETQDNVMTYYTSANKGPVKMNGDSNIQAFGQTSLNTSGSPVLSLINISGNIDDGVTINVLNATTGVAIEGVTISNLSINADPVSGYIDLYNLTSITFTITYDGVTTDVSYSAYVIPTEVTAEKSIHADASTILLFQTIPVFIVLGMIVAVVGVLYMKTRR